MTKPLPVLVRKPTFKLKISHSRLEKDKVKRQKHDPDEERVPPKRKSTR